MLQMVANEAAAVWLLLGACTPCYRHVAATCSGLSVLCVVLQAGHVGQAVAA
jgi:hypothetical protein